MHLLTLVACLAIALSMAGGALSLSIRPVPQGRSKMRRYLPALMAWIPLGVFAFWHPAGLALSVLVFQVLFAVTAIGFIVYPLHRRFALLRVARYTGVVLVALALLALSIAWYWSLLLVLGLGFYAVKLFKRLSRTVANSATSVVEKASTRQRPERRTVPWLIVAAFVAAVLGLGGLLFADLGTSTGSGSASAAQPKASGSPSASGKAVSCDKTATNTDESWKMNKTTPANHRWVTDGVSEIASAKSPLQARVAAGVWLEKVKTTPGTLNGAAQYFSVDTVNPTALVKNGCATPQAVAEYKAIQKVIARSDVTADPAPANGYNSGTSNGVVLVSSQSGVGGNRAAIKIVMSNGKTIWIMARCGNPVTQGPPPNVPTTPPATTPPTSPPTTTPPSQCTLTAPPGYKVVNCQLVKTPCVNANGQACGPNPPFQTPSDPPTTPPRSKPDPLPSGPGGTQAPPSPNPSGYNPGPSPAPGGGASSGGGTTVKPPKPDPTPSCSVSCGSGTQTTSPPMPG
jgi:hypothetical protein